MHNGGRSQVNFYFPSTEFLYLNHLKNGQNWSHVTGNARPDPDVFNEYGYPISAVNGGVYTVFDIPNQTDRPGNWVVRWTGEATFVFNFTHTVVSGSKTATNGRVVFTPTDSVLSNNALRLDLRITAVNAAVPITSVEVCHVDDEALLDAGQVFGVKVKQRLREANFGVYRFLDLQAANTNPIALWSHRKPVNYWSYKADEARTSLWAGTTSRIGNDYTVAAPSGGFSLAHGNGVLLKFDSAGSGTGTLNIGGTGAKTIKGWYGTDWNTSNISANGIAWAMYSEDVDGFMIFGADGNSRYMPNYVPIEILIRLCNEMGAHPWFHVPYTTKSLDTGSFALGLAQECKDTLDSDLTPRFQFSNEIWNPQSAFYGTTYANTVSQIMWGSVDVDGFYGMRTSQMGEAISSVYGSGYQVIIDVQTHGGSQSNRFNATQYVAAGGTAAKNWATHLAVANYWSPSSYGSSRETTYANNYASATTAEKLSIANEYATEKQGILRDGSTVTGYNLATAYAAYDTWAARARTYGLKLCGYEGGYSPDYTSDATKDDLREASKAQSVLKDLTKQNYDRFLLVGGEFPSHYAFNGSDTAWSLLDPTIYSTPSPQWDAIVEFNRISAAIQGGAGSSKRHLYTFPDGTIGWATPEEAETYLDFVPRQRNVAQVKREVARLVDLLPKRSTEDVDEEKLTKALDDLEALVASLERKVATYH